MTNNYMAADPFAPGPIFSGGPIGDLIRGTDWSKTPIGPVHAWPLSLVNYVKMILEMPSPAIIFWGPEQTQIYNEGYANIMGPRHPRYFGAPYKECWPDTYPIVYPWMQRLFEKGETTKVEKTLIPVTRHGYVEETYFTFTFSPLRDDDGNIAGIFQPVVEVTEAVLAERRAEVLRALVARPNAKDPAADIATILSGDPHDIPFHALFLWDAETERLRPAARSMESEAVDRALGAMEAGIRRAFDSRAPQRLNAAPVEGAGITAQLWAEPIHEFVAHPIRRPDAKAPRGVILFGLSPRLKFDDRYRSFLEVAVERMTAVFDTVSAIEDTWKRAEALAELDRAKTEFFSNVSHEFRTPLTLILGPVEDLLVQRDLPAAAREQLTLIHRNSLRLLKLVNTLLDFSRIEAGRMRGRFVPTDLSALTAELAELFRSAIEQAGLAFELDMEPLSEELLVDRELWEKVVLNLLSNAYKFTHEGKITVSLREAGGHVEFTVADTGTGIPPEELPHIFERFHRVPGAKARSLEGSGIGLAMVRELVQLQGGAIQVESRLGMGTTFRISIPHGTAHLPQEQISWEKPQAAALSGTKPFLSETLREMKARPIHEIIGAGSSSHDAAAPSPLKETSSDMVFIVDDNPDVREHLDRILRSHWGTRVFTDAESALAEAFRHPPQLIVSDIMMPGMGGFGLVQRLRGDPRTAEIPILLLSARAGEEATVEGVESGADDYLVKPFSSRELVARVKSRMEIAKVRREGEAYRLRLYSLFMEAPALVAILQGADHVFEFANPAFRRLYAGRDLIGRPIREFFPGTDRQAFLDILDGVYRSGESYQGREYPVKADWGNGEVEEKFFNFVYQPVHNVQGAIEGVAVFAFEVTTQVLARNHAEDIAVEVKRQHEQLRQVEAALRESEERVRLSLESARLGSWDYNPVEGTLQWSARSKEIFGLPPEMPVDYGVFLSALHPEDRQWVDEAVRRALDPAGGGHYNVEYRVRATRDGREAWIAAQGRAFFDVSGRPLRLIGTVMDITDRKAADKEIHKFMTLVEESGDVVMLLDFDGRITFNNAAGQRLAGMAGGNGSSFPDYCLAEDRIQAVEILAEARQRGAWSGEFRLRSPRTGSTIPIWLNAFVLKDHENGRPFALAAVGRDLTQLKETEEHLRQTQKMEAVGKLAGGIAHDFNNLLTAINGYADLALQKKIPPELQEYLREIRKSGERAATLTRQLLAYSRKQVLTPRVINLNAIVQDMEQMLKRLIGEDIELSTRLNPALGNCRADPGQVEQIILNLVFNARDAMPDGGRLTFETENVILDDGHVSMDLDVKPGPYAMLLVRDSGIGMTEEIRRRIFEPFYTTKEVGKGTGLGLSSVYGILKQSGGNIVVESVPGRGTAFKVYLPIVGIEEPGSPGLGTGSAPAFRKGEELILLAEDEDSVRKFIRKILEIQGYRVLEAKDGLEALEMARTHPIQILLTDVIMPGLGGFKLAEQFHALRPLANIILMSGYMETDFSLPRLAPARAAFLKKPFTSGELFAVLHDALEGTSLASVSDEGPGVALP